MTNEKSLKERITEIEARLDIIEQSLNDLATVLKKLIEAEWYVSRIAK